MNTILYAAAGTGFLFFMTALGASAVFFFGGNSSPIYQQIMPGFAAGVMLAASFWSLLDPAIASAAAQNMIPWIPAAGGMTGGVLFLLLSDVAVTRLRGKGVSTAENRRCTVLLQLAMTLHNIPEGMAVGLSFALAAEAMDGAFLFSLRHIFTENPALSSAAALALGIGIQNFPEGAAISLPLRRAGMSRSGAFLRGCLSGIVEPVFGVLTVLAAGTIAPLMPWLLSFAAGAMLYVVAEELIPEANGGTVSFVGTLSIMTGFLIMMILDVALG
ncbi:MAG: ZIP family metal transporter [Clostridia bacterium]|nr:ZIP family metal transporter [Clostridia bacterium]